MKFMIILLAALFGIAFGQQRRCPANMIQLFNGVACSTDAMCYNMAPGYFCLNGYCCANSASSPSGYGSSCTYQSQCSFANSQCLNNICYCASGYDYDGYNCQGGQSVPPSNNICGANEVLIDNQCYQNSKYFGDCTNPEQCLSIKGICRDNKCMCDIGYVFNGYQCILDQAWKSTPSNGLNCDVDEVAIYNKCYPSRRRGQQCYYSEQCILDGGLECRGGICQDKLQSDQYPIPLGPGPVIFPPGLNCDIHEVAIYNKCYPKRRIGEQCFFDVQCVLDVGLECRDGICQIDLLSGQFPIPRGPGPVIFPPQHPQPRPFPPQFQPFPYQQQQQPPQITVITICCLRMNSWPCCNCAINQVLINGRCYSTSLPGGSCQYDQQCNDPLARKPLYCGNRICRWVFSGNPTCRNPNSAIERLNGVIKNCLYQDCSFGYQCEYNQFFNNGQYICCSTSPSNGNGNGGGNQRGQIKFYPGTSLPLECRAINACTFVDFPHCVYSQRYGYQVCCSTKNCS